MRQNKHLTQKAYMIPTGESVIEELIAGNKRFLEGQSIKSSKSSLKRLKDFAEKGHLLSFQGIWSSQKP
jgi:hypothetical protein